jgi:hypothetical protein
MSELNLALVLATNYVGAEWSIENNDYSTLIWLSDTPKPTRKELEKQWAKVQFDLDYDLTKKIRQTEYSKVADPLFFKFQAGEATEKEWLDARAKIALEHPYPATPI